ncbi:MAG TPA: hypothetical protein ENJ88_10450 [Phaeodactylibacter sp.]|nr:hypothetical protein [Phaeodactylibacter sp.]
MAMILSDLPFVIGLGASAFHVLTGPDHLAAVTPLVLEEKRRFTPIGIAWGVGHVLGMALIGLVYLFFKPYIPIESVSMHSEQLVGVVLIFLGMSAVYRVWKEHRHHVHPHVHESEDGAYVHIHGHEHRHLKKHGSQHDEHRHDKPFRQNAGLALAIGVLHGFAGIAHLFLLLPALGFAERQQSVFYLLGFATGAILAMGLYALFLGKFSRRLSLRGRQMRFRLRMWGGALAIVVGVYWILG